MTIPTTTPLGATTLVRKWKLDIDTSTTPDTPTWVRVMGIGEFKPNPHTATLQEDSDYDSDGYKSSTATAQEWGAEGKLLRKVLGSDATAYDVGQEALRLASAGMGLDNRVHVRFYEDNGSTGPKVEAYEGYAVVDWTPDGGGMDGLDTVSVKLTGQGKLDAIAHPAGP